MSTRTRLVTTLSGLALLGGAALAQDVGHGTAAPDPGLLTWSRTYGGAVDEQQLLDVRRLPGNRLAVAGYTASFGGPTQSGWLLHLDLADGDVLVQKAATSTFGGYTDGAGLAADGGALFTGRDVLDIFVKHDAWLIRVDATGTAQWSTGFTRPGLGKHFLFDAAELGDGSWVASGATSLIDQPPQAAWLVRLSPSGVPLWHSEYGGGDVEAATAVVATSDGGFAVAGHSSSAGAGGDDAWVMKLDADGDIEWQRTYGGADADQAQDLVELPGGGYAVVGSTNSLTPSGHAPWILRLDADGKLLWHRVVAGDVWGDMGAVAVTGAGRFVVIGRVAAPGAPSNDLWCAELDADGADVLWQRTYAGPSGDYPSAILPLRDTGLVLGGTWGWGLPGESLWVQRADAVGRLPGCGLSHPSAFPLTSPKAIVRDGAAVRAPGGAIQQVVGVKHAASAAIVLDACL